MPSIERGGANVSTKSAGGAAARLARGSKDGGEAKDSKERPRWGAPQKTPVVGKKISKKLQRALGGPNPSRENTLTLVRIGRSGSHTSNGSNASGKAAKVATAPAPADRRPRSSSLAFNSQEHAEVKVDTESWKSIMHPEQQTAFTPPLFQKKKARKKSNEVSPTSHGHSPRRKAKGKRRNKVGPAERSAREGSDLSVRSGLSNALSDTDAEMEEVAFPGDPAPTTTNGADDVDVELGPGGLVGAFRLAVPHRPFSAPVESPRKEASKKKHRVPKSNRGMFGRPASAISNAVSRLHSATVAKIDKIGFFGHRKWPRVVAASCAVSALILACTSAAGLSARMSVLKDVNWMQYDSTEPSEGGWFVVTMHNLNNSALGYACDTGSEDAGAETAECVPTGDVKLSALMRDEEFPPDVLVYFQIQRKSYMGLRHVAEIESINICSNNANEVYYSYKALYGSAPECRLPEPAAIDAALKEGGHVMYTNVDYATIFPNNFRENVATRGVGDSNCNRTLTEAICQECEDAKEALEILAFTGIYAQLLGAIFSIARCKDSNNSFFLHFLASGAILITFCTLTVNLTLFRKRCYKKYDTIGASRPEVDTALGTAAYLIAMVLLCNGVQILMHLCTRHDRTLPFTAGTPFKFFCLAPNSLWCPRDGRTHDTLSPDTVRIVRKRRVSEAERARKAKLYGNKKSSVFSFGRAKKKTPRESEKSNISIASGSRTILVGAAGSHSTDVDSDGKSKKKKKTAKPAGSGHGGKVANSAESPGISVSERPNFLMSTIESVGSIEGYGELSSPKKLRFSDDHPLDQASESMTTTVEGRPPKRKKWAPA